MEINGSLYVRNNLHKLTLNLKHVFSKVQNTLVHSVLPFKELHI